jgi:hypothetical protein
MADEMAELVDDETEIKSLEASEGWSGWRTPTSFRFSLDWCATF